MKKRQAIKREMDRQNSAIFQQKLIEKVITDIDALVIETVRKREEKKKRPSTKDKPARRNAMQVVSHASGEEYVRRQSLTTQDDERKNGDDKASRQK